MLFFLFLSLFFITFQQQTEAVNNYKQCVRRCELKGNVISIYNPRKRLCTCRRRRLPSLSPSLSFPPFFSLPPSFSPTPAPLFSTSSFNQVFADSSLLCEIYRPDPTRDYRIIHPVYSVEYCLMIGFYDSRAGGLLYYPKNQTCIKASRIQLTDVDNKEEEDNIPLSFYRKGLNIPSYYAGYCSLYDTKETCEAEDRKICGWKQGKQGINQIRVVDLGWCGRIRCIDS